VQLPVASVLTDGWRYVLQCLFMVATFSAIPFADAMIVRFVHDSMRSRVSGTRLAVSAGRQAIQIRRTRLFLEHYSRLPIPPIFSLAVFNLEYAFRRVVIRLGGDWSIRHHVAGWA
jgi:hypothetical protein